MTFFEAIILAIVEGLTEFLPVSSTGHMILTQFLMGMESTAFVKAFTVAIQFGAILSVVCLYWKRFFRLNKAKDGLKGVKAFLWTFDFYWKLFVAFLPAAVIGLACSGLIDEMLEKVWVVALMLVIGGIFMLFADKLFDKMPKTNEVTNKMALRIGLFQCLALIPGVSRSMATIVGGMAQNLSKKDAAEFSFFLAVPTMFAATIYKIGSLLLEPQGFALMKEQWGTLLVGNIVAFLVAALSIKVFINMVERFGFKFFGVYRIIVGGIILLCLFVGQNMEIV